MKKYGIVNKSSWGGSDSYQEVELRETKSFLIDDNRGVKYKKVGAPSSWFLASKFNNSSHRYSRSTDFIVDLDGEYVKKINEKRKTNNFIRAVHDAVEIKLKACNTVENAKELSDALNLGIEL